MIRLDQTRVVNRIIGSPGAGPRVRNESGAAAAAPLVFSGPAEDPPDPVVSAWRPGPPAHFIGLSVISRIMLVPRKVRISNRGCAIFSCSPSSEVPRCLAESASHFASISAL